MERARGGGAVSARAGTKQALLLSIHSECMYVRVKDTCHKIDDELRRKDAAAAVVGDPSHTRLYSFRFSCSMVSFTAANTKRMFSVSATTNKTARFYFATSLTPP